MSVGGRQGSSRYHAERVIDRISSVLSCFSCPKGTLDSGREGGIGNKEPSEMLRGGFNRLSAMDADIRLVSVRSVCGERS